MLRLYAAVLQLFPLWISTGFLARALTEKQYEHLISGAFLFWITTFIPFLALASDGIRWLRSKKPIQTATTFWREFKEFREWRKRVEGEI